MVSAEDGKVLGLDVVDVSLVDNTNAAAGYVVEVGSMDGGRWGVAAAALAGPVSEVGAAVVAGKVGRPALVASYFDGYKLDRRG